MTWGLPARQRLPGQVGRMRSHVLGTGTDAGSAPGSAIATGSVTATATGDSIAAGYSDGSGRPGKPRCPCWAPATAWASPCFRQRMANW